ncbi:hypothetical protein E2C01_083595 [Portunus trituberculatus]|uniref:Uncharacterized protein n=1 Tax=Portunus trituberculatus TaxID=210409 RepID=A0A5B7J3X6_PORTR|nr:hypothetical protein [Portunus trituberculatus]
MGGGVEEWRRMKDLYYRDPSPWLVLPCLHLIAQITLPLHFAFPNSTITYIIIVALNHRPSGATSLRTRHWSVIHGQKSPVIIRRPPVIRRKTHTTLHSRRLLNHPTHLINRPAPRGACPAPRRP